MRGINTGKFRGRRHRDDSDDDHDDDDDDDDRRGRGRGGGKGMIRNKYVQMIYNTAAKFDNQAEYLLDQNMCTDVCPCYQKEMWKTINGKKAYRIDP